MNENVTLGIPYAIVYVSMQSGILWFKKRQVSYGKNQAFNI